MVVLKEKTLNERGTVYSKVSPKEAWSFIEKIIKSGNDFQVHLGSYRGSTFMEARYNKTKMVASQIVFLDTRTVNNRLDISLRDVVSAEIGKDEETGFETVRIDLKSMVFVSITPM